MLFDVSPSELIVILLVALIVFGPKRLPEMARKLSSIVRDIQGAAGDLQRGLEKEVRELTDPIKEAAKPLRELKATPDTDSEEPSKPKDKSPEDE
ncbi:MAG: twin-arginine translocase TatA/TatE family subunit [Acidimicrobiia bacterium]